MRDGDRRERGVGGAATRRLHRFPDFLGDTLRSLGAAIQQQHENNNQPNFLANLFQGVGQLGQLKGMFGGGGGDMSGGGSSGPITSPSQV